MPIVSKPLFPLLISLFILSFLGACSEDGSKAEDALLDLDTDQGAVDADTSQADLIDQGEDVEVEGLDELADEDAAQDLNELAEEDTQVEDLVELTWDVESDGDQSEPGDQLQELDQEADLSPTIPASSYCEESVDIWCPYYLRCGRMAATDLDDCRQTFLESCNAVYEPHYAALESLGMLELSRQGLQACAEHLEAVACEEQIFDLDGGCGEVWRGLMPADSTCAPGVESFVCDGDSTCVLSLDFCGTCQPAVGEGQPCDTEIRCQSGLYCLEGACVSRALPGEACGDIPCVSGATCVGGLCQGRTIVGLGESCNSALRCPYRAACVDGECVQTALLGESCAELPCATGYCEGGICVQLLAGGSHCTAHGQCLSGICDGDSCMALPGSCF